MKILAALFSLIVLLPVGAQSATYSLTATVGSDADVSGSTSIFHTVRAAAQPGGALHALISGDRSLTHVFSYDATGQVTLPTFFQGISFETQSMAISGVSVDVGDRSCLGAFTCTSSYFTIAPASNFFVLSGDNVPVSSAITSAIVTDIGLASDPSDPYVLVFRLEASVAGDFGTSVPMALPDIIDLAGSPGTFPLQLVMTLGNSSSSVNVRYGLSDITLTEITPAVPLPAGLPLFVAALGGLAALRRRKVATA